MNNYLIHQSIRLKEISVLLFLSVFSGYSQIEPPPDPCLSAVWTPKDKQFNFATRPPGLAPGFFFWATLRWEQKQNGMHICKLRRPSILLTSFHEDLDAYTWEHVAVKIDVEIEGFRNQDFFRLDQSQADPFNSNMASYTWGYPTPLPIMSGGRPITWTWRLTKPQPLSVSIGDPYGDVIDLDHVSATVVVTRVTDMAGNPVVVEDPGNTVVPLAPGAYDAPWAMKHTVSINK